MSELHESVEPRSVPPGAPAPADVCFSSRWHHPADEDDPHDTFRAAADFHATRLDWVYFSPREPIILKGAHSRNYRLGGALSSKVPEAPTAAVAEPLGAKRMDGDPVVAPWKRTWSGSNRIWGCINNPEYQEDYLDFARDLVRVGADRLHRDEPRGNLMCVPWGGCFCQHCVRKFRAYLADNTSAARREELGIDRLEGYDCAAHFRSLGAPVGDDFGEWNGGRLKDMFTDFQRQSTVEFHRRIREQVNEDAGFLVPWSCNNCGGDYRWDDLHSIFDFAIGEVYDAGEGAPWIWRTVREARDNGKAQVFTVARPERHLNRCVIATSYACGGHTIVPWDVFTGGTSPRLYGDPAEYADLYGFVRANAPILDGYAEAAVAGSDMEARNDALRVEQGSGEAHAFLRLVPGWKEAPMAVHVVDWAHNPEPVTIALCRDVVPENAAPTAALLRTPAPYDAEQHRLAEQTGRFGHLVEEEEIDLIEDAQEIQLRLPAPRPWSIAVLQW
jgi:hypothetical protein